MNLLRKPVFYGLVAEFETPEKLIAATNQAYAAGYRKMEAYTPFPVEGIDEALRFRRNRVPLLVLLGGLGGCLGGFGMQYFAAELDYPINVGGRPFNSWPAFIPVTFEMTILVAAVSAVLGMLLLNGLPQPYHPLFNVERFVAGSHDRFFLCIEATDPKFDRAATRKFLENLPAKGVYDVAP